MNTSSDKPVRILIVDDNDADTYLLEKVLRSRNINYQLDKYHDGEGLIRALSDGNYLAPDLILLDLNLPRRDGFEVLCSIRGQPALVGVPVGILTSSEAAKDKHRAKLMGAERFIHKPPMLEDFLHQVGDIIHEMLSARPKN
jgi:two-component system, chemotaxis family, response regulator Rcp1